MNWLSRYYQNVPGPLVGRWAVYYPTPGFAGDPLEQNKRRRQWKFNRWCKLKPSAHRWYWRIHGYPEGLL